jgi:integrase
MTIRKPITQAGGRHARTHKGPSDLEVAALRLGRYPFAGGIKYYMERKRGVWKNDTTVPVRERDLRRIGNVLEDLKRRGKVATTDPRHMKEVDIRSFAVEIKHLDPNTQALLLRLLNGYLKFMKNRVLDDMIELGELVVPSAGPKPVRFIELHDLGRIFDATHDLKGWTGSVSRGMVALYYATGLWPSELRLAEFRDLDLRRARIFVRHPKGESNWASQVWVDIIREDMMPLIERYVEERESYLSERDASKAIALFPNLRAGSGFYSANRFRVFKQRIAEAAGVDFSLKMFRSTLCTMTVNEDLSRLPAMSVQLRHSSPETTKKFHAAIDRSAAGRQLRDAWKENPVIKPLDLREQKHPLIDSRFEVSGYV